MPRVLYAPPIPSGNGDETDEIYHQTYAWLAMRRRIARRPRRRLPWDLTAIAAATAVIGGTGGGADPGLVRSDRGDDGGGGGDFGGTTGSRVTEWATWGDAFANQAIEPWYTVRRGTWIETGSTLTCSDGGSGVQAAIEAVRHTYDDVLIEATGDPSMSWLRSGVLARSNWSGTAISGYAARAQATGMQLIRVDNDALTVLTSSAITPASTDTLGVRCVGTTIELMHNGVAVASAIDATYASGAVGLLRLSALGGSDSVFDSIAVQDL